MDLLTCVFQKAAVCIPPMHVCIMRRSRFERFFKGSTFQSLSHTSYSWSALILDKVSLESDYRREKNGLKTTNKLACGPRVVVLRKSGLRNCVIPSMDCASLLTTSAGLTKD